MSSVLTFLFWLLFLSAPAGAADTSCAKSYQQIEGTLDEPPKGESALKEIQGSYFDIQKSSNKEAIAEWNQRVLRDLNQVSGTMGVSEAQRQAIMDRLLNNPVTDLRNVSKYDSIREDPGKTWGFCFGRAMAAHFFARDEGVERQSIRKIWAVGTMQNGDDKWGYHVATMLRGDDAHWYVLDPRTANKPMLVEDWVKAMQERAANWVKNMDAGYDRGKLQIFSSEAKRMWAYERSTYNVRYTGPEAGVPKNMILRDPKFNGYFEDLLQSMREEAADVARQAKEAAK